MELELIFKEEPCNWDNILSDIRIKIPNMDDGFLFRECPVHQREKAEKVWLALNQPNL